jgi:hypothetical protein
MWVVKQQLSELLDLVVFPIHYAGTKICDNIEHLLLSDQEGYFIAAAQKVLFRYGNALQWASSITRSPRGVVRLECLRKGQLTACGGKKDSAPIEILT